MANHWKPLSTFQLPDGRPDWWVSHSQLPTPILLDEKIRVYFMCRDTSNRSRVGWADFCSKNPRILLGFSQAPAFSLGEVGCFDDMGVAPSCVVEHKNRLYLYYVGITARKSVSLDYFIGLAISCDNGDTFERVYQGPIIGKSISEPFLCTSPFVMKNNDSWTMIYTSGVGWIKVDDKFEMVYDIKSRSSPDGISWGSPITLLKQTDSMEAIGRPWLDYNSMLYFCSRGSTDFRDGLNSYKILTASKKKNAWHRNTDSDVKESLKLLTKSKMMAYPAIIKIENLEYLFYNGEGFGLNGLEIAERTI